MKYGYTVKINGVLYPAGTEVPVGEPAKEKNVDEESTAEQSNEESVEKPEIMEESEKPKRGRKPKE